MYNHVQNKRKQLNNNKTKKTMALYTEQEVRQMLEAKKSKGCFGGLVSLIIKIIITGIIVLVIIAIANS